MYQNHDPNDTAGLSALLSALSRQELAELCVWYAGEAEEVDPALFLEVAYEYDRRLAAEKEAYARHAAYARVAEHQADEGAIGGNGAEHRGPA